MFGYLLKGAFFALLLGALPVHACLNEYFNDKGSVPRDQNLQSIQIRKVDTPATYTRITELKKRYEQDSSTLVLGELGYCYMLLGDATTAKETFLEVERRSPGFYATAANLGTAYELLGQADSALIWINRALALDPASHHGSEWIHRHILQVKLALLKNPDYLTGSSILNLDFGDKDLPVNTYNLNMQEVKIQLIYQLSERMYFVPAPDQIVGQLLFDLGNITAITDNLDTALQYYKQAQSYGYDSPLLKARIERIEDMDDEERQGKATDHEARVIRKERFDPYLVGGIIAVVFVILLVLILRRRKRSRPEADA